jgi:hypothetical protein
VFQIGFWVEAMFTTVYMMNRYPTMAMKQKTSDEKLSRRKPKVNHLNPRGKPVWDICLYNDD